MKRDQKYWNQLARLLGSELTEQEKKSFRGAISEQQAMINEVDWMERTWKQVGENPSEKYSDTAAAWKKLSARMDNEEEQQVIERELRSIRFNQVLRIAAMVILILSVGIPALYFGTRANASDGMHHAQEGIMSVDLPDGSRVLLNKGSMLELNERKFQEERTVTLKGEGYFDVLEDPEKPFQVHTGKVVVTVLGTSFNVKESPLDVQVLVESGKVSLSKMEGNESSILTAGEIGVAAESISTGSVFDPNYLSWKTRRFKFVDEPVDEVLQTLSNAYHMELSIGDVDLSGLRLTTAYSEQSFDAILSTICAAFDLDYVKQEEVYILRVK